MTALCQEILADSPHGIKAPPDDYRSQVSLLDLNHEAEIHPKELLDQLVNP
jgi:hypothetical protein